MVAEATIDGYFAGQPAVVMSLFLDQERLHRPHAEEEESILASIRSKPHDDTSSGAPERSHHVAGQACRRRRPRRIVWPGIRQLSLSHPRPGLSRLDHGKQRGLSNRAKPGREDRRGGIGGDGSEHRNAEMTDFATLPETRGLGLAQHLLSALENDMVERGIYNLYTIARARSAGMNRVFFNGGYSWTGTLVNNCHIAGDFEDMHVWCKDQAAHRAADFRCEIEVAAGFSLESDGQPITKQGQRDPQETLVIVLDQTELISSSEAGDSFCDAGAVPRNSSGFDRLLLVEKLEIDLEEAGDRAVAGDGRDGSFDIAVLEDPFAQQLEQERVAATPAADRLRHRRR